MEETLSPQPAEVENHRAALLRDYRPAPAHYDELAADQDGSRRLRPHWESFVGTLAALGLDRLDALAAQLSRRVRENGVTYNVYAEAEGGERPWNLDLLPLILPQSEWTGLAASIEQRARLANAMVADLYGAQRLVREGLLPPALVHGHPGYFRACHGASPAGGIHLHVVAFDLARDPGGRWCVVSQRTQAPSGAGYALENRLLCSQLFPDAFRSHHVRRLSGFFATLQNTLLNLAPAGPERPFVALLTPGPYNETYFEHAYLARYLGHALVQGGDLTVREDRLYLKTVEGLQRVHVLMRRLDDEFCDPLELKSDSQLGVPGLMQAVRAGTVVMANALGSAPLESPAIMAFLPGICRALFGEDLNLPSVESWWLGEEAAAAVALPKLKDLIVKPANPRLRFEPVFGSRLDAAGVGAVAGAAEGAAAGLRAAGPRSPVLRDRLGRRARRSVRADAARVRRFRRTRRLLRDAGRPDAGRPAGTRGRLDTARRGRQGYVDRRSRDRAAAVAPAGAHHAGRAAARGRQPALARGRKPLLARPLRRARGERRAALAHRDHPARGVRQPARLPERHALPYLRSQRHHSRCRRERPDRRGGAVAARLGRASPTRRARRAWRIP